MPYVSDAQRRFFHTKEGMKKVGAKTVKEFDQASKGLKLPDHKEMSKRMRKGSYPLKDHYKGF